MNAVRVPGALTRELTEAERGVSDDAARKLISANILDALARYAADLGRRLTEVEQAAVAESEAVCERREARFAARQALLSNRERAWLGMSPKVEGV